MCIGILGIAHDQRRSRQARLHGRVFDIETIVQKRQRPQCLFVLLRREVVIEQHQREQRFIRVVLRHKGQRGSQHAPAADLLGQLYAGQHNDLLSREPLVQTVDDFYITLGLSISCRF